MFPINVYLTIWQKRIIAKTHFRYFIKSPQGRTVASHNTNFEIFREVKVAYFGARAMFPWNRKYPDYQNRIIGWLAVVPYRFFCFHSKRETGMLR